MWIRLLAAVAMVACTSACTERVSTTTPTGPGQSTPSTTTTSSCTYEISPTSRIHGPGGETGTVTVSTSAGCTWTASSSVSWIRITSGASATGSAVVSYAVEANGGEGRTGTLTMAGRDFGVEQARPACLPSDLSDLSRWTVQVGPSPGTVRISGQRVELRVVSGQTQAGIVSRCSLQGDFDVQVDFQRVAFPAGSTYGLRLGARIGGQFLAVNRTPSNYSLYLGSALIAPNIPTPDASGRLRLARTATSVAGYYGSGSGWVRVGAATLGIEPATFVLDLSSGQAATPSETVVAFENFRVNTGTPVN